MRILVVTQYFRPENFIINHVVAGLTERGIRVDVLTGMPNYPSGVFPEGYGGLLPIQEPHGDVAVLRVPMVARGRTRLSLLLNYLSFAFSAATLGPILLRGRFDAILVYQPSPLTVAIPALVTRRFKGGPVMLWVQDLWPESFRAAKATTSPLLLGAVRLVVRFIYRRCDLVLIPSEGFRSSIEAHDGDPARIRYVPNAVESFYQPVVVPADAPERSKLPPQGFKIVYGGNIGGAQDFETVLAAAAMTRDRSDIHWTLIGDGRMREQVATQIARRNLAATVHLLGPEPPARMPFFFSLADALLVTLRKDPIFALTIPSKLQAYLACGRPILAGLDGEAARLVEQSCAGITAPAGDPSALAAAAVRLATADATEREIMGRNARTLSEQQFSREVVLDRLVACLGATAR